MKLYTLAILLISVLLIGATADEDVTPPVVSDVVITPHVVNSESDDTEDGIVRVCLTATDEQSGVHYIAVDYRPDNGTDGRMRNMTHQMRISGDRHHGRYCSGYWLPPGSTVGGWHINLIAVDNADNQKLQWSHEVDGNSIFRNSPYTLYLPTIHTR